jgi:hypothetical protein
LFDGLLAELAKIRKNMFKFCLKVALFYLVMDK